jgi:hypothetical protein
MRWFRSAGRRIIEDMMVRTFVEKTRNDSIRRAFLGRSPDTATRARAYARSLGPRELWKIKKKPMFHPSTKCW